MSTANEWDVELNTRREIPYLRAPMYHFVYHINTIALYAALLLKTLTTNVKKYDTFSRVLLGLFSGPEILVWHRSLCDNC